MSARAANAGLVIVLLLVVGWSLFHAIVKPFWFDELFTLTICRLGSMAQVWDALKAAADGNPPVFYAINRLSHTLIADEHLAYRIPSMIGVLVLIVCVYAALSRRIDRLAALAGATFVLCTPIASFAYEARPYGMMLGSLAISMLAWSRVDESRMYAGALAVALGVAVSLHYWAVLVWPAFLLAEATYFPIHKRLRGAVWAALIVGAIPLWFWRPLTTSLKQYYGNNFWARPNVMQLFESHDWLFRMHGFWGWLAASVVTIVFVISVVNRWRRRRNELASATPFVIEEGIFALVLLWAPFIAVAVAKITHSAMDERYMQPAILGAALVFGYLMSRLSAGLVCAVLALMIASYSLASLREVQTAVTARSLYARRTAAAHTMDSALAHSPNLPLVISSGLEYLPAYFYSSADQNRRIVAVIDPPAAAKFGSSDSVDLGLQALRPYASLHVEDYQRFIAANREFLLISGNLFDWLTARFLADGQTLMLLSQNGNNRLYKVVLKQ